jgi:bifunctional UDP-N-acetylglucosamine pyrophosphorylase/glucosamine-1-phosphate N-acetyltransferase
MTDGVTRQETGKARGNAREATAIVLAAGKSTRMKSDLPKVMHDLCGRPMLSYVVDACREAGISTLHVVVGFGKEVVAGALAGQEGIQFVEQAEQKGTGHAVSMCADVLKGFVGDVVVIAGDMPMIRAQTLRTLLGGHRAAGSAASIATTVLDDPTGYGRIVRDADGGFGGIVEHRDCDPEQLKIREVNPSYYCFDAEALFGALPEIKPDNAKGELYLTDVLTVIGATGRPVLATTSVPSEDAVGINSRADLAAVAKLMQRRIGEGWMERGVTLIDPENTWIDSRATIGSDTVIKPFSYIEGRAKIGAGCSVGPFAYVGDGAVLADGASTGPGVLSAFDATVGGGGRSQGGCKRDVSVVRRPPAQTRC